MENIQKPDQCVHPGCDCPRTPVSDYCSDYCRDAGEGGMDNKCTCGHPECQ